MHLEIRPPLRAADKLLWRFRFPSSQRTCAPPVRKRVEPLSDHAGGCPGSTRSETDTPHKPQLWRHICATPLPDKIPVPSPLKSPRPDNDKCFAEHHKQICRGKTFHLHLAVAADPPSLGWIRAANRSCRSLARPCP